MWAKEEPHSPCRETGLSVEHFLGEIKLAVGVTMHVAMAMGSSMCSLCSLYIAIVSRVTLALDIQTVHNGWQGLNSLHYLERSPSS